MPKLPRLRPADRFFLILFGALGLAGTIGLQLGEELGLSAPASLLVALGIALLAGFALTHSLRRDLEAVERSIAALASGAALPPLPEEPCEPLEGALRGIAALSTQGNDLGEIHEQWRQRIRATAAQEERNRLARDLHDSIKQQLFAIQMAIATTEARWDDDPAGAREALGGVRTAAREGLAEMRALLQELQPQALATAGLVEALREQCEALGYRTGARIEFVPGVPIPGEKLPPQAQEVLFRMAQEALSNVARHARAESVRVALGLEGDAAVLRVEDDGQGFDPRRPPAGLGLRNLEARAASLQGELRIRSAPGSGTAIRVRIPLLRPPEPPRGSLGIHLWREWIGGGLAALAAAWGLATSAPWRHPGRFALVLGATGWYFVVFCLVSLALAADRRRNPSPDAGESYAWSWRATAAGRSAPSPFSSATPACCR